MRKVCNQAIREEIAAAGLKQWEVALAAGVDRSTLCVWMRQELTGDKLRRVQKAVEEAKRRFGDPHE